MTADREAANDLIRAYATAWARLKVRLDAITRQIADANARGEALGVSWLFQQNRLQSLMRQVEDEVAAIVPAADRAIVARQLQAIGWGQQSAQQMTLAGMGTPPPGAYVNWSQLPVDATVDLVGRLRNGSPLRALLDELGPQASQGAREALIRGIVAGRGPREIAREVRNALGTSLARAQTITRTEVLRAYRETSRRSYAANSDVVEGWIWHSALDRRTCAFCWAMHGTIHESDEQMATHPSCRCAMLPLAKTWADLGFTGVPESRVPVTAGSDLFARLSPADQLAVLGPGKYAAYSAGRISLDDLVGFKRTRDWGRTGYERPLRDVLRRNAA